MGRKPSTQLIADWIVDSIANSEWRLLKDVCLEALSKRMKEYPQSQIYDLVEENIYHLAECLRNKVAEQKDDGESLVFEIDEESDPYIRSLKGKKQEAITKLRNLDPKKFEELCKEILLKLGGNASAIGSSSDGGIDFVSLDLPIIPAHSKLFMPIGAKCILLGQAKRYNGSHPIKLKEIREFIGSSALRIHEMRLGDKICSFTPIILAFWTSGDFMPDTKAYAKKLGIWHMNGWTMIDYLQHLSIPL